MIQMSERLLTLMQWRGNRYKEIAGTLPGLITRHSEGGNAILRYPSGSAGVCLDRAVPQTAVGTDKHRPTPQVSLLSLWHPDQYFYLRTIVSNITALPCILQYLRRRWLQKLTSHRGRSLHPGPGADTMHSSVCTSLTGNTISFLMSQRHMPL